MKESKFIIWVKDKAKKAKDGIIPILAAMIPGLVIGGSITALFDNARIKKLETRFGNHIDHDNNNVDAINDYIAKTNDRLEELTRQNNQLFERALRETEGKAS